jgi:hypothetical protein
MMLRERGLVAGVVGLCLLAASGISPGQAPVHKAKVVQPDDGAPPEQAVQPDQAAPLDQTMPADPGIPPEENPPAEKTDEEKPPEPAPPAPQQAAQPEAETPQAEPAAELAPKAQVAEKALDKPPEKPFVASTPQQAVLQKEAVRLLQLTQELKAEIDKAGMSMLSLAALRKADEVQKLSKDLKERMKDRGQVVVGKP